MALRVVRLQGDAAALGWAGYLSNASRFERAQRQYAHKLPIPDLVYVVVPKHLAEDISPHTTGTEACSMVSLSSIVRMRHREILYVHTRKHMLGGGLASLNMRECMSNLEVNVSISTVAEPCRAWHAALFFLRMGFTASLELGNVDVTLPQELTTGHSETISFTWTRGQDPGVHRQFLTAVRKMQATHRFVGDRAARRDRFVKELDAILETYESANA